MEQNPLGERFNDYKLVQSLDKGGFASVYLGEEVHTGALAAVKLLKGQQLDEFVNNELRRTILLQHPNIIKIIDFGTQTSNNAAFIIMEYAPYGSLRKKYPKDTRLSLEVLVPIVKQIASALQYAHDQRVIHRDVKPENVLLNSQNKVLLSDFGIATASLTSMSIDAGQAKQAAIAGTYPYMAPEQFRGRPTFASDQYSLAIMVYEWLCGKRPFHGEAYQWFSLHEKEPPPPLRATIPSLSPDVERVVLKALAKKPEERFDRVELFALALERAAQGEDVSSLTSPSLSSKHSLQSNPSHISNPSTVSSQTLSNPLEQLFQEGVRARTRGDLEEAFRLWRQIMTTPGVPERYSTAAHNRIRELRPQMLSRRLKQARKACLQGLWQDEIRFWQDILILEPSTEDLTPLLKSPLTLGSTYHWNIVENVKDRLRIAQQNSQSAWMYTGAQQLSQNKEYPAARNQLEMLWQDAPYYGDPADLAQKMGFPAAMNYEQAIAIEQARLAQEQAERELEKLEKQEQEKLRQLHHKQARMKQVRHGSILLIIIGIIVLLGVAAGGVEAVIQGTAIGDAGGVIADGILIGAVISGILAGTVIVGGEGDERIKELMLMIGAVIVATFSGIAGGVAEYLVIEYIAAKSDIGASIVSGIVYAIGAVFCYGILSWLIGSATKAVKNVLKT